MISSNSGRGTQISLYLAATEEIDAYAKANCHSGRRPNHAFCPG